MEGGKKGALTYRRRRLAERKLPTKEKTSGRFYRVLWLDQRPSCSIKSIVFCTAYWLVGDASEDFSFVYLAWSTAQDDGACVLLKCDKHLEEFHPMLGVSWTIWWWRARARAGAAKKLNLAAQTNWGQNHWMRKLIWHPSGPSDGSKPVLIANSNLSNSNLSMH